MEPTPDGIQILLNQTKRQVIVAVVNVYRFIQDLEYRSCPPTFSAENNHSSNNSNDADAGSRRYSAYDLLIQDDRSRVRCALSPRMSSLVSTGSLIPGSYIRITEYRLWYGTNTPSSEATLIVQNLTWLSLFSPELQIPEHPFVDEMTALPNARLRGGNGCLSPLIGRRAYYVDLENDDGIVADNWRKRDISFELTCVDPKLVFGKGMPSIQQVLTMYTQHSEKQPKPKKTPKFGAVVGRVIQIGRICHFARSTDEKVPWPLNFEIVIADASDSVKVSIWGPSCATYFESIQLGQIVAVVNYTIKPAHNSDGLQLKVNAPRGRIFSLSDKDLNGLSVPEIEWDVRTESEIDDLGPNDSFDLLGMVTFAGRLERHRSRDSFMNFAQYRWLVIAVLGSVTKQLPIKVYTNSRANRLADLRLGDVVLLTNVFVENMSSDVSTTYVRSSFQTQILKHPNLPPFLPHAGRVISASNRFAVQEVVGRFHTLFFTSDSIDRYLASWPDTEMVPLNDVPIVAHSLHLHERLTVLTKGLLQSVSRDDAQASSSSSSVASSPQTTGQRKRSRQEISPAEGQRLFFDFFFRMKLGDMNSDAVLDVLCIATQPGQESPLDRLHDSKWTTVVQEWLPPSLQIEIGAEQDDKQRPVLTAGAQQPIVVILELFRKSSSIVEVLCTATFGPSTQQVQDDD